MKVATRSHAPPGSPAAGGGGDGGGLFHHIRLAALFVAITGCFLVYSLIQERLMTLGFGPAHERFTHSLLIILANRLVAVAVAAGALRAGGAPARPAAPPALFAVPSLANVLGSASQYEALKYVSFPLQALAKCAKMVPVMAWGLLLGGRQYGGVDYVCAAAVTLGCALFVLTGSIVAPQLRAAGAAAAAAAAAGAEHPLGGGAAASAGERQWLLYGLLLLGAFLLFDGLTSTAQDRLFVQYDMHSCNQLLWVSAWSAGISLALLVAGGQLAPALAFVGRHPPAAGYVLALSLVSTAVQLFIFYTIQQYGALHFALIMTLRQFLSIVLSCAVFRHSLSPSQWLGTLMVIGGLAVRAVHRGGLARSAARTGGGAGSDKVARRGVVAKGAAALLPLASIPVIDHVAVAAHGGAGLAAVATKRSGGGGGGDGIPLDVQAGAAAHGAAVRESVTRALRRGSPLGSAVATPLPPLR